MQDRKIAREGLLAVLCAAKLGAYPDRPDQYRGIIEQLMRDYPEVDSVLKPLFPGNEPLGTRSAFDSAMGHIRSMYMRPVEDAAQPGAYAFRSEYHRNGWHLSEQPLPSNFLTLLPLFGLRLKDLLARQRSARLSSHAAPSAA